MPDKINGVTKDNAAKIFTISELSKNEVDIAIKAQIMKITLYLFLIFNINGNTKKLIPPRITNPL